MIDSFRGDYAFLSNMHECNFRWQGRDYPALENAYQAMKCIDETDKYQFTQISPSKAKRLGRKIAMRPDFNGFKYELMRNMLDVKFSKEINSDLLQKLLATQPESIIEGNWWHDNYWGICKCDKCKNKLHYNYLGELLQRKRNLSAQHSDMFTMYQGSIYNRSNQAIIERPSVLYDKVSNDSYVMLKIGSYNMCRDYMNLMVSKMPQDMTSNLVLYEFHSFDYMDRALACEKMNQIISSTGSLKQVLNLE